MNSAKDARTLEAYGKTADVDVDGKYVRGSPAAEEETAAMKPPRFAFLKSKKFWIILALGQMLSWCIVRLLAPSVNSFVLTFATCRSERTPSLPTCHNPATIPLLLKIL